MTDYTKLVQALRCCIPNPPETCEGCTYNTDVGCNVARMMSDAAAAIEALQAQLPKRGKWIGKSDDDSLVKCSVCGHIRIGSSLWYCKQYVPYCENCGAKMMEVQDGQE